MSFSFASFVILSWEFGDERLYGVAQFYFNSIVVFGPHDPSGFLLLLLFRTSSEDTFCFAFLD